MVKKQIDIQAIGLYAKKTKKQAEEYMKLFNGDELRLFSMGYFICWNMFCVEFGGHKPTQAEE